MTALLVVMLIVVGGLLAWVVRLLLNMPQGGQGTTASGGAVVRPPVFKDNFMEQAARAAEGETDDVADRALRKIDRKIDILKELIKQADQRIEELQKGGFMLPAEYPEIGADNGAEKRPRRRGAFAPPQAVNNASGARNIDEDRRSKIVALKRKGRTSAAIAREVGMGLGEVELILKIEGY